KVVTVSAKGQALPRCFALARRAARQIAEAVQAGALRHSFPPAALYSSGGTIFKYARTARRINSDCEQRSRFAAFSPSWRSKPAGGAYLPGPATAVLTVAARRPENGTRLPR